MVITTEEFSLAIGSILQKTSDETIKNVIGAYDQQKSAKENIKLLSVFNRDPLQETCAFLKTISSEYPVPVRVLDEGKSNGRQLKPQLAENIVAYIEFLKPTLCLSCKENYVPTGDDYGVEQPKCYLCKRPSHSNCYKAHKIDADIGVLFVCSECLSVKVAKDLTAELSKAADDSAKPKAADDPTKPAPTPETKAPEKNNSAQNNGGVIELPPREERSDLDKEAEYNRTLDCPLYKKRQCPHGLTGKKLIEGKACKYKHRKLCKYFAQFGPNGCRYKNKCRYYHPQICENSQKLKLCLNKSCSEYHTKGTKRYAPDRSYSGSGVTYTTEDSVNKRRTNNIQPWSQWKQPNTPPADTQQGETPNADTRGFLDLYLEHMKSDLQAFIAQQQSNYNRNYPPLNPMFKPGGR